MFDWFTIWPLLKQYLLVVGGMTVYCIIVFSFYKKVSKRHIFALDKEKKETKHKILYALKYMFLGPIFLFFWFCLLGALIFLLSKNITVTQALLVSIALLAAIRVTAYYDEALSVDVAKIIPLGLLAVFLVDITSISFPAFFEKVQELPGLWFTLLLYFVFTVLLEFMLRIYAALTNE